MVPSFLVQNNLNTNDESSVHCKTGQFNIKILTVKI